ncbi:MAG: sensor histidine kinase [Enterocloster sp.]
MDTKLKNNHKWGILLILAAVLAVSAATIALYPYMQKKALEYYERRNARAAEEEKDFGNTAVQIMNFSYEIWRQERQEQEGRILTGSQVFLPELERKLQEALDTEYREEAQENRGSAPPYRSELTAEESENAPAEFTLAESTRYDSDYYLELQSLMDEISNEWQSLYHQYSSTLFYAVEGADGSILRSNISHPENYFKSSPGENELSFTVEFSHSGRMSVQEIGGREEYSRGLLQAVSRFEFYDPLAVRLTESYRYSGVEFEGPRDTKILFRCDPAVMNDWNPAEQEREAGSPAVLRSRDYLDGGGFYGAVLTMSVLVAVLALALPAVKSFEIGRSRLCRLAFEPLSCIGFLWLVLMAEGSIPVKLIMFTMNGSLEAEITKTGISGGLLIVFVLAVNLLFWAACYGAFYWGITCYRAIFSLGPWRYFKERTWIGRFLRWIKRWVCRGLNVFQETDWESHSTKIIGKAVIANFLILTLISCLWFWGIGALIIYSAVLFYLLKKYWGQMQEKYRLLLNGINRMAEGNLDVEINEDLGVFNPFKEQLSRIQDGFKKAVAQEVKSERTKSELITNVSHDLKTPLTAIITYVNLLKEENISDEDRKKYIQILDQKSMRLKNLIEDLFEVSKAHSGTVTLHQENVDIVSLLKQVYFELTDKIETSGIDFRLHLPEERIILSLDSQKTYRIFENLLINIIKYGMKGTRAYIQITQEPEDCVSIVMRNISANELDVSGEELTERFVRGDQSRNTEGSGLGLAIARSFVEVQGGTMKVETEEDIFRVTIRWRLSRVNSNNC